MRLPGSTAAMPELPEVETTRRSLEKELHGRRITAVEVRHPRTVRKQLRRVDFADRLLNRRVVRLRRHGKFLLFDLDTDLVWVTHLGMSGRIQVADSGRPEDAHTHVIAAIDTGRELRFVDPRTFGFMAVLTPEEISGSTLHRLGPDAYTDLPSSRALSAALAGRTAPIKALLLDQDILAGIGNIYADETLHRARLAPLRPGGGLTMDEVKALRAAIKATLEAGLRWGGTSLDDLAYLLPDGRAGRYLSRLRAYGREGGPCRRCGSEIQRTVIRARSSFWCPGCQR
jgi:formamidopyrimidine-DNA glycosylase